MNNLEKPQYVITQDTFEIYKKLSNGRFTTPKNSIGEYFYEMKNILKNNFEAYNEIQIRAIDEETINQKLNKKVETELSKNIDSVCICLDRFLLPDLEKNKEFKDRFFRFGITRKINGDKVPRQGSGSFDEQLSEFSKIPNIKNRKIIIADDGFFSGSTMKEVQKMLETIGVKEENIKKIGYLGNNPAIENSNNSEVIESISNLFEWIDIRDFSVFGGRLIQASKNNKFAIAEPYLYPWSKGESASLDNQKLFEISKQLIESQKKMILEWEKSWGRKIIFKDAVNAGFPLPCDKEKTICPNIKTEITTYLDSCLNKIETEKNRQVYVFDMDGTLYQLDGKNNGYSESSLEKRVNENMLQFIIDQELCSQDKAQEILDQAIKDPVGASQYLSNQYQITRVEYFNKVWDINPKDIVKNYDFAKEVISKINPEIKLILLTSAPKIWAQKVLSFLGIKDKFEKIITGEEYKIKSEIFEILSRQYKASNITSIGDQYKTDIEPAEILGYKSLLITDPQDIKKLSL